MGVQMITAVKGCRPLCGGRGLKFLVVLLDLNLQGGRPLCGGRGLKFS